MFKITTTLRTFGLDASNIYDAINIATLLLVDGEKITAAAFDGPVPFIIVETTA